MLFHRETVEKDTHVLPVLVCQDRENPHFSSKKELTFFLGSCLESHQLSHAQWRVSRAQVAMKGLDQPIMRCGQWRSGQHGPDGCWRARGWLRRRDSVCRTSMTWWEAMSSTWGSQQESRELSRLKCSKSSNQCHSQAVDTAYVHETNISNWPLPFPNQEYLPLSLTICSGSAHAADLGSLVLVLS